LRFRITGLRRPARMKVGPAAQSLGTWHLGLGIARALGG
jgi:hypothetical protein